MTITASDFALFALIYIPLITSIEGYLNYLETPERVWGIVTPAWDEEVDDLDDPIYEDKPTWYIVFKEGSGKIYRDKTKWIYDCRNLKNIASFGDAGIVTVCTGYHKKIIHHEAEYEWIKKETSFILDRLNEEQKKELKEGKHSLHYANCFSLAESGFEPDEYDKQYLTGIEYSILLEIAKYYKNKLCKIRKWRNRIDKVFLAIVLIALLAGVVLGVSLLIRA